ncbi:hypothetical protein AGABI1DRAFT_112623 [Agaricus bisporus var. burnettii JB137-S8]|uniref:BTB domain-containing protein n=2 Tax=Agaricus bisporus var. burnettii TaxID=192524 RepID=K5XZM7_AGABU|nr:uncharacterized protein AGABI1DRAFT_112623 [Agaricus bisporus var. burnettii JB137-S8]EKM80910.1 hypothetical protein AGABI1DRAFT_112623 [Agaricus bisporus var. burnettii JB137-S8]KAF7782513.1 hypothetical protein Agabi119p4_1889 [Agaricus bisporus var. burnettii]
MTTNPSHILIARNSRGPNNPIASLSSPTETHAAAAGIFRSSGSPPWVFHEYESDDDAVSDLSYDANEAIELDDTFTKNTRFPGTVKIVVESTIFWAHKEVLYFASPFFEAALSGNWSETGRPPSMSSVITISQLPVVPGDKTELEAAMTFAPVDPDGDTTDFDSLSLSDGPRLSENENSDSDLGVVSKSQARRDSLAKLQGSGSSHHRRPSDDSGFGTRKFSTTHAKVKRKPKDGPDAVIVLKEERASTFHDFLKFVYPHLQCTITWNNVESLMNISHKLCVTSLQQECLNFLITHAAGRPIKAMRIAELFEEEELYREASRFVLDNPGGWSEHELNTLSKETLLKMEKRRTWFLERVLKLGLTQINKEYQCCSSCPDPLVCARLLDDKWRQAYSAVFRFGPPQPSMVFRYLRQLEGVSPPLALTQTACQASAKAFTAILFDRMFSLGVRAESVPINGRVTAAAVAGAATGPRRHFLFCSLKPDTSHKSRRTRAASP